MSDKQVADISLMDLGDPTPVQVPCKIGKDHYVLFEPSAGAACAWRNSVSRAARMEDGQLKGWDGLADTGLLLLSKCLAYGEVKDIDGKEVVFPKRQPSGNPEWVPEAVIRSWSDRIQKALFTKAKEVGGLEERVETVEDMVKEREALDKRIAKMREGKDDNLGKGSLTGGQPTSS